MIDEFEMRPDRATTLTWAEIAFVRTWTGRDDDYFRDLVYARRLDDWYRGGYAGEMPRFQPMRSAWHESNRFYFGLSDDN